MTTKFEKLISIKNFISKCQWSKLVTPKHHKLHFLRESITNYMKHRRGITAMNERETR